MQDLWQMGFWTSGALSAMLQDHESIQEMPHNSINH